MYKKKSRYDTNDRHNIVHCIEQLENRDDFVNIFAILTKNQRNNSYIVKQKAMFMDISTLDDDILDEVTSYLRKVKNAASQNIDMNLDIVPLCENESSNRKHKLSNYEKTLLKHQKISKNIDNNEKYDHIDISELSSQKKKHKKRSKKSRSTRA